MSAVSELQFRKRPVVIEAFQITHETRASNENWPGWLHEAWQKDRTDDGSVGCEAYPHSNGKDRLVVNTSEGVMTVGWGDWIIRGVKGELYPCKPDIFAATYEPESTNPTPSPGLGEDAVRFIALIGSAWMNPVDSGISYSWDGDTFVRRQDAISRGFSIRGSDDFNIGVVENGKLVSLDWMNEAVDTDAELLAEIASQINLEAALDACKGEQP